MVSVNGTWMWRQTRPVILPGLGSRGFRSGPLVAVAGLDLDAALGIPTGNTRLFFVVGIASCCMVAGCSPTTGWQWVPTHTHVHVPPSLSSSPLPPTPCQGMGTMLMVPLVAPCHVTSMVATFPCITHCGHADATKHPPQTQLEREDLRPKTSLRPHVP